MVATRARVRAFRDPRHVLALPIHFDEFVGFRMDAIQVVVIYSPVTIASGIDNTVQVVPGRQVSGKSRRILVPFRVVPAVVLV